MSREETFTNIIEFEQFQERKANQIKILVRSFELMQESCLKFANKNPFCQIVPPKQPISFSDVSRIRDPRYGLNGTINGKGTHFTINNNNHAINGTIFWENHKDITTYISYGLQKYKEDTERSYYYHMIDSDIISSIACKRDNDFLKEISQVQSMKPFSFEKKLKK